MPDEREHEVGSARRKVAWTRVRKRIPKESIVTQWAIATTGRRAMRVCPRNSRKSVVVRTAGRSVRLESGWLSLKVLTKCRTARASMAHPTTVTVSPMTRATISRADMSRILRAGNGLVAPAVTLLAAPGVAGVGRLGARRRRPAGPQSWGPDQVVAINNRVLE